jgi:hypothetical protein
MTHADFGPAVVCVLELHVVGVTVRNFGVDNGSDPKAAASDALKRAGAIASEQRLGPPRHLGSGD